MHYTRAYLLIEELVGSFKGNIWRQETLSIDRQPAGKVFRQVARPPLQLVDPFADSVVRRFITLSLLDTEIIE